MLYSPAAGILLTITNQITMRPTTTKAEFGKPIVNPDYTLTRPKRLNKFEKVNGVKVVKSNWQEPEKIRRPELLRATTVKGRKAELRRNAAEKAFLAARKAAQND